MDHVEGNFGVAGLRFMQISKMSRYLLHLLHQVRFCSIPNDDASRAGVARVERVQAEW